jgi:hypothetical protein
MTHRAVLAVLALVRLLLPASGEAASTPRPAQASLSVSKKSGARTCPSEKELRREVTAILGYAPFHTSARRRVTAVLWAREGTFHARIQLLDAPTHQTLGSRELSAAGPTCEALASAMALAIALAIDPLARPPAQKTPAAAPPLASAPLATAPPPVPPKAARPSAVRVGAASAGASADVAPEARPAPALSEPPVFAVAVPDAGTREDAASVAVAEADAGTAADAGGRAETPAVPVPATPDGGPPMEGAKAAPPVPVEAPPPAAAAASSSGPAPEGGFHGLVGAGADVSWGLVPSTAFGVDVHGGVAWTFASAEFEARWLPSTSRAFGVGSISSTLLTGALVGCATFQSFGSFGACGVLEAGPFTSQGHGYAQSLKATTWTASLGVRGQWDWVFAHPVGLRVHVDGLINLVRTRLLVGPDVAWQAPSVALDVGVGLLLVF